MWRTWKLHTYWLALIGMKGFFLYAPPGVKSTHQPYPAMSGVNSNNDRKGNSIGVIVAQASWK